MSRKFTARELELGRKMLIAAFITIASALIVFVPIFDGNFDNPPNSEYSPEQVRRDLEEMRNRDSVSGDETPWGRTNY